MPENNKSALVGNNSIHLAIPISHSEILIFAKNIANAIYNSPYCESEDHDFEIEYGDYTAVVEYRVKFEERKGGDHYCGVWEAYSKFITDSIQVTSVTHYNGIRYPAMCFQLNKSLS